MKLYIMRHAEAEAGEQMDPTRPLTETGCRQAKMMGKWLKRQTERPEIVIESNFQRSRSTAKRVAKQLDVPLIRSGFLDPENAPENTWTELKRLATANGVTSVIMVSHGPLVEKLLCYLTGSPLPQLFHFAHAAIAHFDTATKTLREAKGEYTYEEQEMKRWKLGSGGASGENCDTCEENADMGWIDMDETFLDSGGDDIDDAPAHPNCDCEVEQKTKRVRVYESGRRIVEDGSPERAIMHWIVTPNVVARDEDELDLVTHEITEAAIAVAEAALE